ncbi:UNVERIFIED_CONTAM: hypothetical protein NCL1_47738 [Trichonephila clavipes]
MTDFVQSIPGFQECNAEDVETWMACDAEDCGFQMLNNDEILTFVQEESNPVDDKTDEDEDNINNEMYIQHGSHSAFGYPNNRQSERCPVPIDSDKRRASAHYHVVLKEKKSVSLYKQQK